MAWTPEDRRRYAPAIQEIVRQGMLVRLAAMIDTIHPPSSVKAGSIAYRTAEQDRTRRLKREGPLGVLVR